MDFIKTYSKPFIEDKFLINWVSIVNEKTQEAGFDENDFANGLIFKWYTKYSKNINNLENEQKIELCRYFILYYKRNLEIPNIVREKLTLDSMNLILYSFANY